MTSPPATAEPIRYEISCFPLDHPAHRHFTLTAAYWRDGLWTVTDSYGRLYDGGSVPSQRFRWREPDLLLAEEDMNKEQYAEDVRRSAAWWKAHSFPLDEALRVAQVAAPKLKSMDRTVADAFAFYEESSHA